MLIGGNKTTKIHFKPIHGKCPHCSNDTLGVQVYQKYGHLFWIPFIPLYKVGMLHCTHCKLALEKHEVPDTLKPYFNQAKSEAPIPKWTFIGLILFIFLIISIKISNSNTTEEQIDLFNTPQTGDLYEGKTILGDFVMYKLVSSKPNEYKVLISNYQSENELGLIQIRDKNSYSNDTIIMDSLQFKDFKKVDLLRVIREK